LAHPEVIIFGVDPGTARMGYGVIVHDQTSRLLVHGVLETPSDTDMPERLRHLFEEVGGLLDRQRPDVVAVEQLFFARNVTTAITVGQARGVVLLAAALRDIPVREYSPSEIKHAIVGYGKADKAQIQEMVKLILELDAIPRPDDAADAVAVAICHAHHSSGYGAIESSWR
jgi:crossover junction endodeoxyribonuclease RuvC